LKLHHGYPEPFGLALRWSVFGFFWKQFDMTRIMVGCSVEMLKKVFQNDVYKLRTVNYQGSETAFQSNWGGVLMEWYLGDGGAHAGWHCSWCMPPDRIQIKLISALNADFPRWGDFPDKRDLTYIRNLIKTGTWFDDKTTFNSLVNRDSDPVLAPAYMLEHFSKYEHLLDLTSVK
jgi:beta-1,4-mannosyl-glycoprotein beta-1,4-N-acetylglucosaminyltransferase